MGPIGNRHARAYTASPQAELVGVCDRDITRAETVTMVNRCLRRAMDETGLTEDYLTWPDNQKGSWYYYEIIEAANYHDYARSERPVENHSYTYENWTYLHELIDWAYVEREWILIYTGE